MPKPLRRVASVTPYGMLSFVENTLSLLRRGLEVWHYSMLCSRRAARELSNCRQQPLPAPKVWTKSFPFLDLTSTFTLFGQFCYDDSRPLSYHNLVNLSLDVSPICREFYPHSV